MSLHYWFRNPSGVFEEITDRIRLYSLDVSSNAEEATIGTSELIVDDPLGDLIIGGHRRLYILEDAAASSNQVVWNGYTAERTLVRDDGFRTATARRWKVALVDHNTILERRILTASSANRPAETDVARMQWVEATAQAGLIDDTQWLSTANPVAMDAVDYRGQTVADVVNDCMQQSGKNCYLWLREEVSGDGNLGALSIWYDYSNSTNYTSPIHLTNIVTEVNGTDTFAISEDTEMRRDPSRVYSGVYGQWDGGNVYVQRSATSTAFSLGGRDVAVPMDNVKSVAKAEARANRLLTDFSTEEDVITTTVHRFPASLVNMLMPGMQVRFKATHLDGYQTESYLRILNRNVVQTSEEYYSIRMELSTGSGASGTVGGVVETDAFAVIKWPVDLNDGTGNLQFQWDGNNPHVGDPSEPLVGGLAYAGAGGARTGISITTENLVDIHFQVSWLQAYGDTHPFTIVTTGKILINGATVAIDTNSEFFTGFPGTHAGSFILNLSNVTVSPGDLIQGFLQTTKDGVPVADPGVPSGAGSGANQLKVTAGSYT